MRILCIDVGTGTQDILLFDSSVEIENCVHMVMPSPTEIVARGVRHATENRHTLVLTGPTMGGGPCAWAVEAHIREGLPVFATPDAARTFDDDLERVEAMGVRVIGEDEAFSMKALPGTKALTNIELGDIYIYVIDNTFAEFDEPPDYDAIAVAVFDHGAAPPGYSDRRFRFDYISQQMSAWGKEPVERALAAFAAPAEQVHPDLTRLQAAAQTVRATDKADLPLLLMDTGPAALLGALGDPTVRAAAQGSALFANVGNFHTLAFHIVGGRIRALFEHHTGLLDGPKLMSLMQRLASGDLTNEEIFDDSGHGALTVHAHLPGERAATPTLCAVTGPRRAMLSGANTSWPIYLAVPHGDMMLSGCFGLLRAYAAHFPEAAEEVLARLDDGRRTPDH
jgi:uncharacterized protein (DUF1786 family)